MTQHNIPVFSTPMDLYTSCGAKIDPTLVAADFSFYNLGDLPVPGDMISSSIHRAGFHFFFFVKNAKGRYWLNECGHEVMPGTICFGNPGDVIQFCFRDVKELCLLAMSESFLKEHTHACTLQEFSFLEAAALPPMVLSNEKITEFEQLYEQIKMVYLSGSPLRKKQIGYLLPLLFLKIKEKLYCESPAALQGRQTDTVSCFKQMLQRHYQDLYNGRADRAYNVREYAAAMRLHPNYLNDVIRRKTGRPVSKWIIEKTITEAKFLLDHSGLSIKEIAYRLGFLEASYFSRYFKKYTQLTAAEYRARSGNTNTSPVALTPMVAAQTLSA